LLAPVASIAVLSGLGRGVLAFYYMLWNNDQAISNNNQF